MGSYFHSGWNGTGSIIIIMVVEVGEKEGKKSKEGAVA